MAFTKGTSVFHKFRPSSSIKAVIASGISIVSFVYWGHFGSIPGSFTHQEVASAGPPPEGSLGLNWTRTIWQTSKYPLANITDEGILDIAKTWPDMNPGYKQQILTDQLMDDYVKEHFQTSNPEFERVFFEVKDYILRSDLIRYLVLLAHGGVYNDLDVGCEKPIETWVPPQFQHSAGILLGVEIDNNFGPDGRTFTNGEDLFELVNWTIMAKPNQPFMRFLVERVVDNIRKLAAAKQKAISAISTYSIPDVLVTTGPMALTTAFFDYASEISGTNVTYKNFTKITKPKSVGEVVILPIQAFGAGHQIRWAGFEEDGTELIHHYFAGTWKVDHHDGGWQDAEQKAKEEAQRKSEEEKKTQDALDKIPDNEREESLKEIAATTN